MSINNPSMKMYQAYKDQELRQRFMKILACFILMQHLRVVSLAKIQYELSLIVFVKVSLPIQLIIDCPIDLL